MRQRKRYARLAISVALAFVVPIAGQLQARSEQQLATQQLVELLTEEEADQLQLTEDEFEWGVRFNRGTMSGETDADGPLIVIKQPEIKDGIVTCTTPLKVFVAIQPRIAAINKTSLKITARKGIFRKDITDSAKPYPPSGNGGWGFGITGVKIPPGRYRIDIAIADLDGRGTVNIYYFIITEDDQAYLMKSPSKFREGSFAVPWDSASGDSPGWNPARVDRFVYTDLSQ